MPSRLIAILAALLCSTVLPPMRSHAASPSRPNILWITSEDNSHYLGCYGDPQARTPNLDKLATQGVRYRHAFANAPVCSAARSTLITGMHASSAGIHNHRSSNAIPGAFRLYPELLRQANELARSYGDTLVETEQPVLRSIATEMTGIISIARDCDEDAIATPSIWVECIEDLEKAGFVAAAQRERERLLRAFPDYELP